MKGVRRQRLQVDVDGGQLTVERSGQGPALLMVHGWAMDHRLFDPQRDALENEFETVVFDRRGFGTSSAPPDLRLEVADMIRILDTLGIEQAHLLGMSQGGRLALRFAAEHPERVRSLVLQGPAVDGFTVEAPESERVPVQRYANLVRDGDLAEFRRQWRAHPMMAMVDAPAASVTLLEAMLEGYEGRDLAAFAPEHYGYERDILDRLSRFPRPVLLLTGAEETTARKVQAHKLLSTFPDAREVILEHGGHLSNLEEPEAYNAALRSFCLGAESC